MNFVDYSEKKQIRLDANVYQSAIWDQHIAGYVIEVNRLVESVHSYKVPPRPKQPQLNFGSIPRSCFLCQS